MIFASYKSKVGKKILYRILLFSFFLTLLLTMIQFLLDYNLGVNRINTEMDSIYTINDRSIANALWNYEKIQVELILQGIVESPNVSAVRILTPEVDFFKGKVMQKTKMVKKFPIYFNRDGKDFHVGDFSIFPTLDHLYTELQSKLAGILISQFVKTIIMSIFILHLVEIFVIRPIFLVNNRVAMFSSPDSIATKETLKYKRSEGTEIGELISQTNYIGSKLFHLHKKLKNLNENLELEVSKQTYELESTVSQLHREIEEKVRAQEIMVHSSKMSALGEMSAGVAHEINNPLSAIKLRATQIEKLMRKDSFDKKKVIDFSRFIDTASKRIQKIVDGLRTYARNSDKDSFTSMSLKKVLEDTLVLCSVELKHREIALKIDEIPNVNFHCHPSQISQVLLNLLTNARDAVSEQKEKWIKLAFEQKDDRFIEISVIDSGPGIPPETVSKIMQPFFTTKEIGKGTGLGLSISKGLIEAHEGILYLDTKSESTKFVIKLPFHQG